MKLTRDSITESPWQNITTYHNTEQKTTEHSLSYDVIVVGAGITGITTALMLQKAGKNCLIIEAGNIGFGTTGGTTAHINTFFDVTYPEIESDFDGNAAKLVADAGKLAIDTIRSMVEMHQIECDLENKVGYLFSETEKESEQLNDIFESAQNAGVEVERSTTNGLPISFLQCLKFDRQAQFHPLKYLIGLANAFTELGGTIKEHTFINEVKNEDGICLAIAENEVFKAENLIYATHVPPGINKFSLRCAPYRSYVLGVQLSDENQYPSDLAYDMKEPYHYFRTHIVDGKKILIIGGEDHKTGHADPQQAFANLEDYASKRFIIKSIPYQWSSQYYVPVDGLPYIGRMSKANDRVLVATGYNGNGITWGTIAGHILSDLILQKENPLIELFDPCRMKPIAGFSEFVKENADVAYHFMVDRFKSDDLDSFKELTPGSGKVVDFEGKQLAIYMDKEGIITALNPICTHAGCVVNFNEEEKSWDCPCHGGRFDLDGKVLCGPPRDNLQFIPIGK